MQGIFNENQKSSEGAVEVGGEGGKVKQHDWMSIKVLAAFIAQEVAATNAPDDMVACYILAKKIVKICDTHIKTNWIEK